MTEKDVELDGRLPIMGKVQATKSRRQGPMCMLVYGTCEPNRPATTRPVRAPTKQASQGCPTPRRTRLDIALVQLL